MRLVFPLVSGMDRITRLFIGAMMMIFAFMLPSTNEWIGHLVLGSLYPLVTALTAWDPLYNVLFLLKEKLVHFMFFH